MEFQNYSNLEIELLRLSSRFQGILKNDKVFLHFQRMEENEFFGE